jgi:predicted ATP-grasp superfamily ATP-dependent carboligase
MVRSLGRRGWKVIAAGEDRASIGFHSRFASNHLVYPSPSRDSSAFVDSLLEAVAAHPIDLIVPVTDAVILPLHESRHRFVGRCQLALPDDAEALRTVMDKDRTMALAASVGVPIPRTVLARSVVEARDAAAELGWPVVMKPRSSRVLRGGRSVDSFEVGYAGSAEDLELTLASHDGDGVLLQEYCSGIGRGVGFLTHEGRPIAAFQHRRVHEVPITGGASSLRESEPIDPTLYEYSRRILASLKWTGLALVEFKTSPSGPKLMEVNGRVWGSLPLAVMSGVDFPGMLVDMILHGPPPQHAPARTDYRAGVRARNLALDTTWLLSVLGGRRRYPYVSAPSRADGIRGVADLFNPMCRLDVQSLSDPIPGLAELPQIVRRIWHKGLRWHGNAKNYRSGRPSCSPSGSM